MSNQSLQSTAGRSAARLKVRAGLAFMKDKVKQSSLWATAAQLCLVRSHMRELIARTVVLPLLIATSPPTSDLFAV